MPKRANGRSRALPRKAAPVIRKRPRPTKSGRPRKIARGHDPFLHCVYGPLDTHSSGTGAPDGSVEPSVVVDHRSVVRISPDANGDILVAIIPSPYGAVAIGAGSSVCTINQVDTTTIGSYTYMTPAAAAVVGTTTGENTWPLIPYKENLRTAGPVSSAASTGLQATKYRVLTTQCQAEFTGSSMFNAGVAATCKIAHHFSETVPFTVGTLAPRPSTATTVGARLTQLPPATFDAVASIAGSRVFPARQSAMMVNAPQDFGYQEVRNGWSPFYHAQGSAPQQVFAGVVQPNDAGVPKIAVAADPIPGLGHASVTYYAASGLDANSSITLETRTCVEYTLAFESPAARFASLPAAPRPQAMLAVKEIGRAMPSSFPVTPAVDNGGWLSNAASWYGSTMKSLMGSMWQTGGQLLSTMGPSGRALGGGISSLGGQMSHLAITG